MQLASRVRDATVEAVLAGALVGVIEGARTTLVAGAGLTALPVIAAVAALGAILAALGVRVAVAILDRVPMVRGWGADIVGGGGARVVAIWRGVLALASLVVFGIASYLVAAWSHETFRFIDAGPVGLLLACTVVPIGAGILVGALALDRRVAPRLQQRQLTGTGLAIAAAIAAVALAAAPALLAGRAAPAVQLTGIAIASILVVAVIGTRVVHAGQHRAAQIAACVALAGALAGTWALGTSPRARGAIVVYGVASERVARTLWSIADRDGDGYAGPGVGGADCDDADARRSPGAQEIAGNGIDENCTGADAAIDPLRTQQRQPSASAGSARPNIVLISIDALRADHLGSYGYARPTSPVLDAFAKTATRFAWAMTSCPSTRCAIPSLLSGRYASTLGYGLSAERAAIPNVAAVLRDAGWTTAAITCCARFALGKRELSGFQTLDASADAVRMQRAGQSNADTVADSALEWLGSRDPQKPYFLWLHFYDPHFPYSAPKDATKFGNDDVDRYDAEIRYVDEQIGRVLAALDPQTIVVVTADHGDEFGEHGIRFHARSLYNQVVRIPLLVRAPGAAARVIDTPVSLVDVMPTLLDLAGVTGPAGMNGVSLASAVRDGAAPARPVFVELTPDKQIKRDMAAVISPPWKVIWDREANAWSLYGLDDVADTRDRADDPTLPSLQKLLRETLDRETARLPGP
ncbi:MAG: sulfatase-like hydrolase/transferase [Kofleriaceae bacterium]|nr:sulfatase-like hydrolase/transferase [Kofleriaceae bacterium]